MGNHRYLEDLVIRTPCDAQWENMVGDDVRRHCGQCGKDVYNVSGMKRSRARRLLAGGSGKICIRMERTPDGSVVTASPTTIPTRKPLLAAAVAVLTVLLSSENSAAQDRVRDGASSRIVSKAEQACCRISFTAIDPLGEAITGISIEARGNRATFAATTNADGVATFDMVPAGKYTFTAGGHGFLPSSKELTISRTVEPNLKFHLQVAQAVGSFIIRESDLPIFEAVLEGDSRPLMDAVNAGFNLKTQDSRKRTALHFAAQAGDIDLVKFLIARKVNVNAKDNERLTPLLLVGGDDERKVMDIARLLLEHGADVDAKDEDGETLLMKAVQDGNVDGVKLVLAFHPNVDQRDPDGDTAIDMATSDEIKKLLIAAGAKVKK